MTIKFYPSRLPGEPLETHEHGVLTLHEWMSRNVPSYSQDKTHPVVIELNGQTVPRRNGRYVCCGQTVTCGYIPFLMARVLKLPRGFRWPYPLRLRPMHYSLPLNQSWAAFHPVTLHRWI